MSFWLKSILILLFSPASLWAATITFTVDPSAANSPISPLTYGSNGSMIAQTPLFRSGGNRLTAYNWENNYSNAGSDYFYENDTLMGSPANGIAGAILSFVNQNKSTGAESLVTLQLAGYVSADAGGPVPAGQYAPSSRFFPLIYVKGSAFNDPPNTADSSIYLDECVNYLLNHIGSSANGGIKYYELDNEPALWPSTHPEVHTAKTTYAEVLNRGVSVATMVTSLDPGAQIFGPVAYGYTEFVSEQMASDAGTYSSYPWFLDYYLDQMRLASLSTGRRLLHYLDVHFYTEATDASGNPISGLGAAGQNVSPSVASERMQAPRSLWDPTYTEHSWITQCCSGPISLLPRLQAGINQYYPGTKIAVTEHNYGAGDDVSGGIAEADALGIFGKYGVASAWWDLGNGKSYVQAASDLYLNYDGASSKFGDTSISAQSSSVTLATVYAAKSTQDLSKLWVVALNKDYSNPNLGQFNLALPAGEQIASIKAYRFDPASPNIVNVAAPAFGPTTFTQSLPARSASLYEVTLSGFPTATATASPTATLTPTRTSTPSLTPTGTLPTATFTPTRTFSPSPTRTPTLTWSPTPTATGCVQLFNGCETLAENGNWTGTNATRSIITSGPAGSITQGTHALQVNVTTKASWNDQILNLDTFVPSSFIGVMQLQLDINMASSLQGASYSQLALYGNTTTTGYVQLSADLPGLLVGQNNNVTFNINVPSAPITQLMLIFNNDSAAGTGSFYVDNIRLVRACNITQTATPSLTNSFSPTSTRTPTPTATVSFTPTGTNSFTLTMTPTNTNTPIFSYTFTNTFTRTNTPTDTGTFTSTGTNTFTTTRTNTSTFTPTSTFTVTPTNTNTGMPTNTFTSTSTNTASRTNTSTNTHSPTVTSTSTSTSTNTPTLTWTGTNSFTPTNSNTRTVTPSATASSTPTASFTASWTNTATATATFTATGTSTFTNTSTRASTASMTLSPTFSATASLTATPTASPTRTSTATSTSTFTALSTVTFTNTSTSTPTSTKSFTPTKTNSPIPPTFTLTSTPTLTLVPTSSSTFTVTMTSTPSVLLTPLPIPILIYPDPSDGTEAISVIVNNYKGSSDVEIQVFTTAFRKVEERRFQQVPSGTAITFIPSDKWGNALASGIYFIVAKTSGGRVTGKWLILR